MRKNVKMSAGFMMGALACGLRSHKPAPRPLAGFARFQEFCDAAPIAQVVLALAVAPVTLASVLALVLA